MDYKRMPIESEAPEFLEPDAILYNLTESSNANFKLEDLGKDAIDISSLLLAYGDHLGKKELRELIAKEAGVHPDEVLITTGASLALFIISTAILQKGDRLVVEYPNYVINLETPRLLGAKVDNLAIKFEDGFKPLVADIEAALQTEAKMLSLSIPHNPVGSVISESELKAIVELTEKKGTILLMDETYREMHFDNPLPIGASLGKHVISISSMSKTYGLPGIRIGWLICRDPVLMEKFLAAKEQIVICGSVLDEEVAYQFLKRKEKLLPEIKASILEKRQILFDWFKNQQDYMEWVEPQVGVVCFPRLKTTDAGKIDEFYHVLNMEYKTWVGPGHWFEMERRYMRIGYGWPTKEELSKGLDCISQTLRKVFK